MIDSILKKYGVGWTLTLMVLELAYINTKSLIYMSKGLVGLDTTFNTQGLDSIFGVIGSLAFSSVTVLIMRLGKRNWLKIIFPIFDFWLVFLGFNIEYADNFMSNPFRFYYSIFIAAFAAFTTYSLGQINAEQHEDVTQSNLIKATQERDLLNSKLHEAEKRNAELSLQNAEYYEGYLRYHKSRILKKKTDLTDFDKRIMVEYEDSIFNKFKLNNQEQEK
jgi:hypothetical protein